MAGSKLKLLCLISSVLQLISTVRSITPIKMGKNAVAISHEGEVRRVMLQDGKQVGIGDSGNDILWTLYVEDDNRDFPIEDGIPYGDIRKFVSTPDKKTEVFEERNGKYYNAKGQLTDVYHNPESGLFVVNKGGKHVLKINVPTPDIASDKPIYGYLVSFMHFKRTAAGQVTTALHESDFDTFVEVNGKYVNQKNGQIEDPFHPGARLTEAVFTSNNGRIVKRIIMKHEGEWLIIPARTY